MATLAELLKGDVSLGGTPKESVDSKKLAQLLRAIARGAPQAVTGLVDLAALPLTLTGAIDSKDVFGSTDYLTKKGLLPPAQPGLGNQTAEVLAGGLMPLSPAAMRQTIAGVKSLGPKAYEALENYMTKTGGMANVVPNNPKPQSQFVPGVTAGDEMIVQHNLTADKLYKIDKAGGMPVPSLAINKISAPNENFGDITLIGNKSMATPSRDNLVFRSDAYTKKAPPINYQIDAKSEKNLGALFSDVADNLLFGQRDLQKLADNLGDLKDSSILNAKFLKEKGILPENNYGAGESYKYKQDIRKLIEGQYGEYDEWANNFISKLPESGVNIKEGIFNGWTQNGKPKYVPATLDNLVKKMKGGANTEGYNYGPPSFRAAAVPKFKNMAEILRSRDKLVSNADFEPIGKANNDNYYDIYGELKNLNNRYDASDAMLEAVESNNPNVLNRIYGEVSQDLKDRFGNYVRSLKDMPTEYFEAKPQRAVQLNEFAGALVPSDIPPSALSTLERNGVREIYKYANPEEKKSLLQKFGKEMFAGLAVPVAASDDIYAELDKQLEDLKAQREALLKK